MQKITPFQWYDGKAEEAANYYTSLFKNSKVTSVNPMMTTFELNGLQFVGLNGGPHFTFTNSISLFVTCNSHDEIANLWKSLSEGGTPLMELGAYPWSEQYGWINDRYGLSWQLFFGDKDQQITPSFLFANQQFGKGENAINLYSELFPPSEMLNLVRFGEAFPGLEHHIQFSEFLLAGQSFMLMESHVPHEFDFNEAFSFFITCADQNEVDYYWDKLIANGGQESKCGWLKDPYGVSWQVVPTLLMQLMGDPDREKAQRVMEAMLKMTKINCQTLQDAYDGK
ncbi:VOC family protein [Flavobacterium sp. SUN046]|uniref:VOC family protein n=1 Tax=Flavobacterium sp. SUN046 TaxID=3002440 RepID=UPI002DB6C78B|nr:VOC family protein [Flavobacterium sp. SUN046]MEC4049048.1 VOC family protein [Flavobacterium sp. SUN046]